MVARGRLLAGSRSSPTSKRWERVHLALAGGLWLFVAALALRIDMPLHPGTRGPPTSPVLQHPLPRSDEAPPPPKVKEKERPPEIAPWEQVPA